MHSSGSKGTNPNSTPAKRKLTGKDFKRLDALRRASKVPNSDAALTTEERALVDALRNLRAVEAQGPRQTPAALLEHGMVSKAVAAELLDVTGVALEDLQRGAYGSLGHELPIVKDEVPISELRRHWERRERQRLLELAQSVVGLVRIKGVQGWRPIKEMFSFDAIESRDGFGPVYDVVHLARRLEVSRGEAQRLMDGPLFNWKLRGRGAFVTLEEVEAWKRKLASERKAA